MTTDERWDDLAVQHIEDLEVAGRTRYWDPYFDFPLITEVLPGLWQGGCEDDTELPPTFDLVIALYQRESFIVGPDTEVIRKQMEDSDFVPDLSDLVERVHAAWRDGAKVLVHCQAGLNRSGLLLAQVLMEDGYSADEAIELLRRRRSPMVLCNGVFEAALRAAGALGLGPRRA